MTEKLDDTKLVISGQAQSVYDLYRRMVLGNADAADYVRPVSYDDDPDIDHPDITNTVGLTYEDVHTAQTMNANIFESEKQTLIDKAKQAQQDTQPAQQAVE